MKLAREGKGNRVVLSVRSGGGEEYTVKTYTKALDTKLIVYKLQLRPLGGNRLNSRNKLTLTKAACQALNVIVFTPFSPHPHFPPPHPFSGAQKKNECFSLKLCGWCALTTTTFPKVQLRADSLEVSICLGFQHLTKLAESVTGDNCDRIKT